MTQGERVEKETDQVSRIVNAEFSLKIYFVTMSATHMKSSFLCSRKGHISILEIGEWLL